jgi:rhodanese-related sulfurtransferase
MHRREIGVRTWHVARSLAMLGWLALLVLAVACGGENGAAPTADGSSAAGSAVPASAASSRSYVDIDAGELARLLDQDGVTVMNVHIPFAGAIAGTDLSIPFNEIETSLARLPADRSAKLVVYCRSDRMSEIAAQTLVDLGYTNVLNLDGGMISWEQSGRPLSGEPG